VRSWWQRHTLLTKVLLALAVLVSAGTAVILGFLVQLFLAGYSGGNNPQSVAPLAFLLAFLGFAFVGAPAVAITAALWVAFARSAAGRRRPGHSPGNAAADD
jgi:hypothetical protein